jgi:uncharacterized protein (DUF2249 family)/quercetin dioxygenase-like cupin family protein
MVKHDLNDLIQASSNEFGPKILISRPGYRMVLLNIQAGQSIPEHAIPGMVTVYVLRGSITLSEESIPCDLHAGQVVSVEEGIAHRVEANQHSALLVLSTGTVDGPVDDSEELDLRDIPGPQRHPLIFARFDALAVGGSLRIINDHDPAPLNRQFENIRPGQALWRYIVRGPKLFRARIQRIAPPSATDVSLGLPSRRLRIEAYEAEQFTATQTLENS